MKYWIDLKWKIVEELNFGFKFIFHKFTQQFRIRKVLEEIDKPDQNQLIIFSFDTFIYWFQTAFNVFDHCQSKQKCTNGKAQYAAEKNAAVSGINVL